MASSEFPERLFRKSYSTLSRYAAFIIWLLQDALLRSKAKTIKVLSAGIFGVMFQIQVFALIVYYAQHFSTGDPIQLSGYSLDPRSSIALLVWGSLMVAVLLLFSALCIYVSRRGIIELSRFYEEFCTKRVFSLLDQEAGFISRPSEFDNHDSYVYRLVRSDSRLAGRVLRVILSMIVPVLTLTAVILVLFYLAPELSFLITILASVLFYYQYRVSRSAANLSAQFEKLSPGAGREYRDLIQKIKQQMVRTNTSGSVKQFHVEGLAKDQLDAYEGRLLTVEKSRLVSGIFIAVVLGLIALIMGRGIIQEGTGWGALLVYIVALRFGLVNLQSVFASITTINRFYPQIHRYFLFVSRFQISWQPERENQNLFSLKLTALEDSESSHKDLKRVSVEPGIRLSLVTPIELNRYTIGSIIASMLDEDESILNSVLSSCRFVNTQHSCPDTPMFEFLGLDPETSWCDLRSWFAEEESWRKAQNQLPEKFDEKLSYSDWDTVDPELKFILSMLSARNSDAQWVFLDADVLKILGHQIIRYYLEFFKDKIVILVFKKEISELGKCDEDYIAVANEESLLALGSLDWFTKEQHTFLEILNSSFRLDDFKKRLTVLDDEDLDE